MGTPAPEGHTVQGALHGLPAAAGQDRLQSEASVLLPCNRGSRFTRPRPRPAPVSRRREREADCNERLNE